MNDKNIRRVAIIGGKRTPFARAYSQYRNASSQQLMTVALQGLVDSYGLKGEKLGDVSLGAVIKHSADWDLARESVLGSGLAAETPAFDIQRACGTGLEAAILIGLKIASGQIDAGIAGGVDSVSDAPVVYPRDYQRLLVASMCGRSLTEKLKPWTGLRPRHFKPIAPSISEPRTGLSMGESCELMAKTWHITRQAQDQLTLDSHRHAAQAQQEGWFDEQLVEFNGLSADSIIRADTSMEKLSALSPVFDRSVNGTLTAGNSSALSDGASAVLLASEDWAREHGLPIMAYLSYGKVAAVDFVDKEGLLMAPAYAVSEMIKQSGISLQDFDFYEIHEAFAAQVLCTLAAWESETFCLEQLGKASPLGSIDRTKMNVKGGSVAIGHPFGATGGRLLMTMAKLLNEKGSGRGLLSICTGGGMGVTAIIER